MQPLDRFGNLENARRIGYLVGGFITRTLTIAEEEELDAWVIASDENMQLFEELTEESRVNEFMQWLNTRDTEAKLLQMKQRLGIQKKTTKNWGWAVAASIVGLIVLGLLYKPWKDREVKPPIAKHTSDILPGANFAELRLPSGQVIALHPTSDTSLPGIKIAKGVVTYDEANASDTAIHEIRVPRKGSYQLLLPDGSRVWLNAESAIRYPGNFGDGKRLVSVTGETFFQVAKDAAHPFVVSVGGVEVEALGTEFNINAFDRKVTLTRGSIRVSAGKNAAILKPGQQIQTEFWKISEPNLDPILAWTKNNFNFRNATIEEVLAPVQRWYDAKIIYEDSIPDHFNGTISREVPVSELLELLEATGRVHFSIQGNTITVSK